MYKDYEAEKEKNIKRSKAKKDTTNCNNFLEMMYKDLHFIKTVLLIYVIIIIVTVVLSIITLIFVPIITNKVVNDVNTQVQRDCCTDNGGVWKDNSCTELDSPYSYNKCIGTY